MPDYKNSKIYKIINDNTDKIYIGSTTTKYLCERFRSHTQSYKKNKCSSVKELFDIGECKIILIENYECNNINELHSRERFWIEKYKNICVNIRRPIISKEEHNEKTKLWISNNREKHNTNQKLSREKCNEIIECECGAHFNKYSIYAHYKTKKHIEYTIFNK